MKNLHSRAKLPSLLATACLALSPVALAVNPPPDGGYPNKTTAEGEDALFRLTIGTDNSALGYHALFGTIAGDFNTAVGSEALATGPGDNNTAVGAQALFSCAGFANTAVGSHALYSVEGNLFDTAVGHYALEQSLGGGNTAVGAWALSSDTSGNENTAVGYQALYSNTTPFYNTAIGSWSLHFNTTGTDNTATGAYALYSNATANNNAAFGNYSLNSSTGEANTAIGINALLKNTTGRNNIALGYNAGINLTTGDNNISIGNAGVADESGSIRIGTRGTHRHTFIAGISGVTVPGGVGVIVGNNGKLGTVVSSERFKDAIKPMDKASEAILALKPVTFHYTKELDPDGIPQFGLVAEQVAEANPDLVARDDEGKPYTVRYEAVNAMLLNEFLKEHRKVEEQTVINQRQEATIAQQRQDFHAAIAQQQKEIQALTAALKAQAAQIQKVSNQVAAGQSAARLTANE